MAIPLQGWVQGGGVAGGSTLQGGSGSGISLQGSSPTVQGSSPQLQASPANTQTLQPTANPNNFVDPTANTAVSGGVSTQIDPAQAAAAAAAAQQAAQAAALRDNIGQLAQQVKDIYNGRYGQVDASASEQSGKLNDRFGKESGQLEDQIDQQNQQAGAAFASNGAYDSSYRGNAQGQITKAGNEQVDALGQELKDNLSTIAQWVQQQKSGFDAGKSSTDTILSHIASETDPSALTALRNKLDDQITTLQSQASDNNTESSNLAALEQVAPSNARVQQLKTTLSSILGGSADAATKASIATSLVGAAGVSPTDQSKLLAAFHTDLAGSQDPNQQQTA